MKIRKTELSGSARMRELGYIRVEIWLKPHQVKALADIGWRRTLAGKCRSIIHDAIVSRQQ